MRVVGQEVRDRSMTYRPRSEYEVILCGGANSPHLLQLSGIGRPNGSEALASIWFSVLRASEKNFQGLSWNRSCKGAIEAAHRAHSAHGFPRSAMVPLDYVFRPPRRPGRKRDQCWQACTECLMHGPPRPKDLFPAAPWQVGNMLSRRVRAASSHIFRRTRLEP